MNAEGELCEGQRKGGKSKWGGLSVFFSICMYDMNEKIES